MFIIGVFLTVKLFFENVFVFDSLCFPAPLFFRAAATNTSFAVSIRQVFFRNYFSETLDSSFPRQAF